MKKVLLVEGRQTIGGGQIVSLSVCKALSKKYDVITFLPGNETSPISNLLKEYPQYYFEQKEYSRGKKTYRDFISFFRNNFQFWILRNIIKKEHIEVIYVQHASMLPTILIACWGIKVKLIVHLHVVYSDGKVRWLMNRLLSKKKIKIILGVSHYTFSQLKQSLMIKCHMIHNPVALSLIQPNKNIKNIAIVGDVVSLKGHHILFDAISNMKDYDCYKIYVIGNIIDSQYKEMLCKNYPNVNAVFSGMIEDVSLYMNEKHIGLVVIASTAVFETFSLAMVEAWSRGVPTIATNDYGMKELVYEFLYRNKDIMLFENGNSEDLRKKIKILETRENLYEEISIESRSVVEKYFNENIFSQNLYEIMETLC